MKKNAKNQKDYIVISKIEQGVTVEKVKIEPGSIRPLSVSTWASNWKEERNKVVYLVHPKAAKLLEKFL